MSDGVDAVLSAFVDKTIDRVLDESIQALIPKLAEAFCSQLGTHKDIDETGGPEWCEGYDAAMVDARTFIEWERDAILKRLAARVLERKS